MQCKKKEGELGEKNAPVLNFHHTGTENLAVLYVTPFQHPTQVLGIFCSALPEVPFWRFVVCRSCGERRLHLLARQSKTFGKPDRGNGQSGGILMRVNNHSFTRSSQIHCGQCRHRFRAGNFFRTPGEKRWTGCHPKTSEKSPTPANLKLVLAKTSEVKPPAKKRPENGQFWPLWSLFPKISLVQPGFARMRKLYNCSTPGRRGPRLGLEVPVGKKALAGWRPSGCWMGSSPRNP